MDGTGRRFPGRARAALTMAMLSRCGGARPAPPSASSQQKQPGGEAKVTWYMLYCPHQCCYTSEQMCCKSAPYGSPLLPPCHAVPCMSAG